MSQFGRFISVLVVAGAALLQLTSRLYLWGVKPDLTLVLILVFSIFNRSWIYRFVLIILGVSILKFYQGVDIDSLIFAVITLLSILLIDYLPWQNFVSYFLVIVLATVVLNASGFAPLVALVESIYNLLLFSIIYLVVSRIYAKKI